MKRFKLGFLAVVAVLAMSFTVISKTSTIKSIKLDDPRSGCFTSVTLGSPYSTTITNTHAAPPNPGNYVTISSTNYTLPIDPVTAVSGEVTSPGETCIPPFNQFCCYLVRLIPDSEPDTYEVYAIAYKP